MFDLSKKIALVTGAASGIGESISTVFAAAGASVVVADIDESNGDRVVKSISEAGGRAKFLKLDVTEREQCGSAEEAIIERYGRLDILVNNAGIGHVGTLPRTTEEDLERLFAVNVYGMFSLTKAFLPGMIERAHGVIINTASIAGVAAVKDRIAYTTTKFAVVGFTKALALDHAHQGIRVNAICPGRVETPFVKSRIAEYSDPIAAYAEMAASQPVGRMARPEEVAAAALYLASDEAAFVTGSTLMIDGGFTA